MQLKHIHSKIPGVLHACPQCVRRTKYSIFILTNSFNLDMFLTILIVVIYFLKLK